MNPEEIVRLTARRYGVPEDLALRVANTESAFNQGAVSPKGARGVMQLMPGTARELGVDPNDLRQNIDGGVRYLKQQLDAFGGDHALALAAYNAGPGAVRKYGGVPPYAETQGYVRKIKGGAQVQGFDGADIFGMGGSAPASGAGRSADFDGAEIFAAPAPAAQPKPAATPQMAARPQQGPAPRTSQMIGAAEGMVRPWQRTRDRVPGLNDFLQSPLMATSPIAGLNAGLNYITQGLDEQKAKGLRPGKVGEFFGNVAATVPTWLVGGPATSGAVSGALLSQEDDLGGVAKDAAIGAASGKIADEAARYIAPKVGSFFSKAAKTPSLDELQSAYKAAYAQVDASGHVFPKSDVTALADDVSSMVRAKGGPKAAKLYADSDAMAARLKALATQPGGVKLSQLDELRSDIYPTLIAPGGKDAVLGREMIRKIDALIDASPNGDIKAARAAYQRFAKSRAVVNRLDSADLRASSAYSGANVDNTIRQKMRPLIDPQTPNQNLRGATPDEVAAIRRVVTGTPGQNILRLAGQVSDPRKLLGMITTTGSGAAALPSGGLSLLTVPAGLLSTSLSNRAAQKNVDELLRLLAAGGSKQALKKVPTMFGRTAQAATLAAPLAAPVAAVAATRQKKKTDQKAAPR